MLSKMQAISSFMTIHAMAQLGKTASAEAVEKTIYRKALPL
jgi:hypothetical protein